jgi:4-cresol dehydrogenase (hydroxylating)
VNQLTKLVSNEMLQAGFEPLISLTLISPRSVNCVISITYDRDVPGEDDRALRCYKALAEKCTSAGYFPYRLGIASMQDAETPDTHAAFLRHLRSYTDPAGILAPGRYAQ